MSELDLIQDERRRWLEARAQLQRADARRKEQLPDQADDEVWWREFGDRLGWRLIDCLRRHRATFRTKHGADIAITDLIRREIEDGYSIYQRALKAAGIVLGREG